MFNPRRNWRWVIWWYKNEWKIENWNQLVSRLALHIVTKKFVKIISQEMIKNWIVLLYSVHSLAFFKFSYSKRNALQYFFMGCLKVIVLFNVNWKIISEPSPCSWSPPPQSLGTQVSYCFYPLFDIIWQSLAIYFFRVTRLLSTKRKSQKVIDKYIMAATLIYNLGPLRTAV